MNLGLADPRRGIQGLTVVLTAEREFESDVHVRDVRHHDAGRVDQVDERVVAHADGGEHGARHARHVPHRARLS